MSTRDLIDNEIASLPEELQQKVYDFTMRLKRNARDEAFNGAVGREYLQTARARRFEKDHWRPPRRPGLSINYLQVLQGLQAGDRIITSDIGEWQDKERILIN